MVVELTKAMERKGLDMRVSALVSLIGAVLLLYQVNSGVDFFFFLFYVLPNS